MKGMKKLKLDAWQEDLLEHEGHLLLCTGRQVGKTTIMAIKAAEYMVKHNNSQIIIVSLTEDQAKLIIVMILDHLERNYKQLIAKGKFKPTQNRLTLKDKATALARPVGNTGDAIRGFTGDILIIDEGSRMPEMAMVSAKPTLLTTSGKIWICSTPHGKQGYFWDAFQNKANKYKVFHISSEEVINKRPISDSWTKEQREGAIQMLKEEREEMSTLSYGQEYLGLFLDDLRRYFPDELIAKCCIMKRTIKQRNRDFYLGVDIARMGDDTSVFTIIDKINNDTLIQVENIITKKTRVTTTEDTILNLNRTYDEIIKIFIDAGSGSLGVGVFDHLLRHDDTKGKIVAINNRTRAYDRDGKRSTRLLKEDLYDNLRSLMERGYIKLLADPEIQASLRSVQYEFTKKDEGIRQMKIFAIENDCVEALIRAAWCSKEKSINIWMKSIKV